jgi:ribulose-phosphate 3-epimerase
MPFGDAPLTAGKPIIAPSLIAADFGRLADEVARAEQAGAEWLHLDIMDGHFVPNLTLGPGIVAALRPGSKMFFDVHLMLTDPGRYAKAFRDAGAQNITFHIEAVPEPRELIGKLRDMGVRVGLAINPETPAQRVFPFLEAVDMVNVMTVHPGFTGQKFLPEMLDKLRAISARLPAGRHLEVDGGVNTETGRACVLAGADVLVAGASVFRSEDIVEAVSRLRNCGDQ